MGITPLIAACPMLDPVGLSTKDRDVKSKKGKLHTRETTSAMNLNLSGSRTGSFITELYKE